MVSELHLELALREDDGIELRSKLRGRLVAGLGEVGDLLLERFDGDSSFSPCSSTFSFSSSTCSPCISTVAWSCATVSPCISTVSWTQLVRDSGVHEALVEVERLENLADHLVGKQGVVAKVLGGH